MNIPVAEETLFSFLFLRIPLLIFFSIATLAVQALRSKLYGYRFYRPFLINIILAWIPFALSIVAHLTFLHNSYSPSIWTVGSLIIWFFFFPNTIYLITEVHHFQIETKVPLWFDTVAILLIVLNGVLLGSFSLLIIHFFLDIYLSAEMAWLALIAYVFVANIGIYIGRYLRFNSWDVVKRPDALMRAIFEQLGSKKSFGVLMLYASMFSLFIIAFYLFIWLSYVNLYQLALALSLG